MTSQVIPVEELVVRGVYRIHSRNLTIGAFDGYGFCGIRTKFGDRYTFTEYLWTGTGGTARPLEFIEMLPDDIDLREREPSECSVCGHPAGFIEYDVRPADKPWARGFWTHIVDIEDHEPQPIARIYEPLFDYLDRLQA